MTTHLQESSILPAPVLLDDTQVSRYLTDGFLVLQAEVPAALHDTIYERLQWVLHEEGNPGNNILPAVPELQQILDCPVVRGALTSVLGPNYALHPHRFVHNNEPGERTAEGEKVGKGSHTFIGWHQDSHSPLSRPRHHYSRYAMILYYPQDTPEHMGPTQIIPSTYLHRSLSQADHARGRQAPGPAGTCLLVHFDLAHGGSLNLADRTRHMAKFVFVRTEEPAQPSWNNQRAEWVTPDGHGAPQESVVVWSHLWNWLSGRRMGSGQGAWSSAADTILALMAAMNSGDEAARQNASYTLAALGEAAVGPLCADLTQRTESRWAESAVVMENSAYALGALGRPAVSALTELLSHPEEWVQINAAFALGEIGTEAAGAVPALIKTLAHRSHPVVRTAVDALGQIGAEAETAWSALRALLTETHPEWQRPLYRAWTGQDQVRTNVMMALLRLGWKSEEITERIAASLHDPCGYVTGFGVECLLRQDTPASLRAALDSLRVHRWDETLRKGVRTY